MLPSLSSQIVHHVLVDFIAIFFRENWQLIGEEFIQDVEYFFNNKCIYYPINAYLDSKNG